MRRTAAEHAAVNFGAAKRSKLSAVAVTEINEVENMTDTAAATTDTQKRANFSALTVGNPNGVNKISPSLASAKPGTARKLVIKNFRSKHRPWDHLTSKSAGTDLRRSTVSVNLRLAVCLRGLRHPFSNTVSRDLRYQASRLRQGRILVAINNTKLT